VENNEGYIEPGHEVAVRQPTEVRNPDAFDIGSVSGQQYPIRREDPIANILSNPSQAIRSFDLTEQQLDNIAAAIAGIISGTGAGLAVKHLSKTFGSEFAGLLGGALGGYLGGYAGKRVTHRKSRSRFMDDY